MLNMNNLHCRTIASNIVIELHELHKTYLRPLFYLIYCSLYNILVNATGGRLYVISC